MRDVFEHSQEHHPLDAVQVVRGRHRSLTMGAMPERLSYPFSNSFRERNGSEVNMDLSVVDTFYSDEDKKNCTFL